MTADIIYLSLFFSFCIILFHLWDTVKMFPTFFTELLIDPTFFFLTVLKAKSSRLWKAICARACFFAPGSCLLWIFDNNVQIFYFICSKTKDWIIICRSQEVSNWDALLDYAINGKERSIVCAAWSGTEITISAYTLFSERVSGYFQGTLALTLRCSVGLCVLGGGPLRGFCAAT